MSENTPEAPASETPAPEAPAAAAPAMPETASVKRSLEDLLGSLDADARGVVLGEVSKARSEAKNLRDRLKDAEPKLSEYDRLVDASKTSEQRAIDAAAAAQARVDQLTSRAVMAEVKALAASSFADPTDATAFIDTSKYVTDDGDVDTDAIKADLEDLLTRKPHLGKAEPGRRTPAPNPAQGSSASGPTTAGQLSKQDLDRMYKAGEHEAIEKARAEGRFNALLGVNP